MFYVLILQTTLVVVDEEGDSFFCIRLQNYDPI